MKSVGDKVRQLQGLVGTKDVRPQDAKFIEDMWERTESGKRTSHLTGPQINYIESLWGMHYG